MDTQEYKQAMIQSYIQMESEQMYPIESVSKGQ